MKVYASSSVLDSHNLMFTEKYKSEPFDDSQFNIPVQYITGMKLYLRTWNKTRIIGGK